jgi:dihydrodipicolinate synthase/N-acetylneuraminate lyase
LAQGDKPQIKKIEAKWAAARSLMGPKPQETTPAGLHKLAAKIAKRSLTDKRLPTCYSPPKIKAALMLQGHAIRAEVRPPLETLRTTVLKKFESQLRKVGFLA